MMKSWEKANELLCTNVAYVAWVESVDELKFHKTDQLEL